MPSARRPTACQACGGPDPWESCPACGARLHPHCLEFGGCPCALAAPVPAEDPAPALQAAGASAIDTALATVAGASGLGLGLGLLGLATWGTLFACGLAAAGLAHGVNYGFFEGLGGASLGKKLMGLSRRDRRGRAPGVARGLAGALALPTAS